MNQPLYYISHVIRSKNRFVTRKDGKQVVLIFQVLTTNDGNRKSICWIEDDSRSFHNCLGEKQFKETFQHLIDRYNKFQPDILILDKMYEQELSLVILQGFLGGENNLQEKINLYNLNKEQL